MRKGKHRIERRVHGLVQYNNSTCFMVIPENRGRRNNSKTQTVELHLEIQRYLIVIMKVLGHCFFEKIESNYKIHNPGSPRLSDVVQQFLFLCARSLWNRPSRDTMWKNMIALGNNALLWSWKFLVFWGLWAAEHALRGLMSSRGYRYQHLLYSFICGRRLSLNKCSLYTNGYQNHHPKLERQWQTLSESRFSEYQVIVARFVKFLSCISHYGAWWNCEKVLNLWLWIYRWRRTISVSIHTGSIRSLILSGNFWVIKFRMSPSSHWKNLLLHHLLWKESSLPLSSYIE